jgi:hypothetical protein
MSDISFPVQADLRYLLNLRPGQFAAQIHFGAHLYTALEKDGLEVHILEANTVQPSSLDVIFLATPFAGGLDSVLRACAYGLKPGGQILLCFPNRVSFKWLSSLLKGKTGDAYSLATARNAAKRASLDVRGVYGIYDSTAEPRFLVPLENHQIAMYFFGQMLTPYTRSAWLLLEMAPLLTALRLYTTLFADLCLVMDSPC